MQTQELIQFVPFHKHRLFLHRILLTFSHKIACNPFTTQIGCSIRNTVGILYALLFVMLLASSYWAKSAFFGNKGKNWVKMKSSSANSLGLSHNHRKIQPLRRLNHTHLQFEHTHFSFGDVSWQDNFTYAEFHNTIGEQLLLSEFTQTSLRTEQ